MEKTILAGDYLLADKLTLGPRTPHWIGLPTTRIGVHLPALKLPGFRHARHGDIVVVETPEDAKIPFVKRVVAVGGKQSRSATRISLSMDGRRRTRTRQSMGTGGRFHGGSSTRASPRPWATATISGRSESRKDPSS